MTIYDDIRKDREAGTPGDWSVGERCCYTPIMAVGEEEPIAWVDFISRADLRRACRAPKLEAIALAAEGLENWLDVVLTLIEETSCDPEDPDQFDEDLLAATLALKAFREASK